jgi:hypothetical protein
MPLCTTSTTIPSRPCVSPTGTRPGSPGPGATGGSDDSSDERRRASGPGCGDPHAVAEWRDGGGRPQAGLGDASMS